MPVRRARAGRHRDARPRLLVIDADPETRAAIARLFDPTDHRVETAGDAATGLEATRRFRPDVVLCDWGRPGLDGVDYCRCVKSDPELRPTHVTLLTGRALPEQRVEGLDAGADDYVVKPFDPAELCARVRAGLRRRRLQRELTERQHEAALRQLAATLGHEINNPLTALFGHMELLLHYLERGESDRLRHHIREAGEVAARIAGVAQRLTDLVEPRTTTYLDDQDMLDLESA